MKKEKQQKPKEVYKFYGLFSDLIICPDNAFEPRFYKRDPRDEFDVETIDGHRVSVEFLTTWKVRGEQDEQLIGRIGKSLYNMSFGKLRSLWIARLGTIGEYWHYVRLIPLNN